MIPRMNSCVNCVGVIMTCQCRFNCNKYTTLVRDVDNERLISFRMDWLDLLAFHSEGDQPIAIVPWDQPWYFFGENDAKAETPVLWPPHAKSWLIGKDSDAGRDWGQEEKGTTEDEMSGWHHWLDGCESEWTLGVGDGQGGLACCDSWGCKESDTTKWLNWTDLNWLIAIGKENNLITCCHEE